MSKKADKRIGASSLVCLVASSCAMFILATYSECRRKG